MLIPLSTEICVRLVLLNFPPYSIEPLVFSLPLRSEGEYADLRRDQIHVEDLNAGTFMQTTMNRRIDRAGGRSIRRPFNLGLIVSGLVDEYAESKGGEDADTSVG